MASLKYWTQGSSEDNTHEKALDEFYCTVLSYKLTQLTLHAKFDLSLAQLSPSLYYILVINVVTSFPTNPITLPPEDISLHSGIS